VVPPRRDRDPYPHEFVGAIHRDPKRVKSRRKRRAGDERVQRSYFSNLKAATTPPAAT
jgi:hypothetical protein